MDLPVDTDRLGKYFDEVFVRATNEATRADAISIATYLAERFDLGHLAVDLAHIA